MKSCFLRACCPWLKIPLFTKMRQAASVQDSIPHRIPHTQPSEPIFFPKLQIEFADFPYLFSSMDQRLLTLGTRCGYRHSLGCDYRLPSAFHGQAKKHWAPRDPRRYTHHATPSPDYLISGRTTVKKRRYLLPRSPPASPNSLMLPYRLHNLILEY